MPPLTEQSEGSEKGTEQKSYREIGQERRSAFMSSVREKWNSTKERLQDGANRIKEFGGKAVDYAFAAPEMVKDGVRNTVDATVGAASVAYESLQKRGRQAYERGMDRERFAKSGLREAKLSLQQKFFQMREERMGRKYEKWQQKRQECGGSVTEVRKKRKELQDRLWGGNEESAPLSGQFAV
ncbi:MAG: hypothetical protein HGA31_00360 [Candidatus Moranbacteria bacterium]|nr:hypothetical protein [Candidatus Moranbacteria bacterium]